MEYLGISLSSSSDVSGGVFYPEYFSNQFFLNDLTNKGPITAIRIEGATSSIEKRLENLKKEDYSMMKSIILMTNNQKYFGNLLKI